MAEHKAWKELRLLLRKSDPKELEKFEASLPAQNLDPPTLSALKVMLQWLHHGDLEGALHTLKETLRKRKSLGPYEDIAFGLMLLESGEIDIAIKALKKAQKAHIEDPRIDCGIAGVALNRGDLAPAERLLKKVLSKHADHYHGRFLLGVVELKQGKKKEALESFLQVTREAPAYEPAWLRIAQILLEDRKTQQAIDLLTPVADQYPVLIRLQLALVDCLQTADRGREAVGRMMTVAETTNDPDHVMDLLEMMLVEGAPIEVTSSVVGVLDALAPEVPRADFLRGEVAAAAGKFEEAVEHHQNAQKKDKDHWQSSNALGMIYGDETPLKDLKKAKSCFKAAAESKAKPVEPRLNLGILHAVSGETKEAKAVLEPMLWNKALTPEDRTRAQNALKSLEK